MSKEELERKNNFSKEAYKHNTGNKPKIEQSKPIQKMLKNI